MKSDTNSAERKLRDALEKAQQQLKVAQERVRALEAHAASVQAEKRPPLDHELRVAIRRIVELEKLSAQQGSALESARRENERKRLQGVNESSRPNVKADLTCLKCGSAALIPAGPVMGHDRSNIEVEVMAAPDALVKLEPQRAFFAARVCGHCGYSEFFAVGARQLLNAHRAATTRRAGKKH